MNATVRAKVEFVDKEPSVIMKGTRRDARTYRNRRKTVRIAWLRNEEVDGVAQHKRIKIKRTVEHRRTPAHAVSANNDILAEKLGLEGVEVIGEEKICRIGVLPEAQDVFGFAQKVKDALSLGKNEMSAAVAISGGGKNVKKVAVVGGSGGDDIKVAAAAGADTFVTGELKYHERLSAMDFGVNLICAGHFFTEFPVCTFLENNVKEICPDAAVEVVFSNKIIEI